MKKNIYSSLALQAMKRASIAALQKASSKNLSVPLWENGVILHVNPKEILMHKKNTNLADYLIKGVQ